MKQLCFSVLLVITLFFLIGLLTSTTSNRWTSDTVSNWTKRMEANTFFHLLAMENTALQIQFSDVFELPGTKTVLQMLTSMKPDDPISLFGSELPGIGMYQQWQATASEEIGHMELAYESPPPLDDIIKDREAVMDEESPAYDPSNPERNLTTGKKNVVFIYNTHNYESFFPHLPGVTDPNLAQHKEVNITKASDRFAQALQANGIGAQVDQTDTMLALKKKGWEYPQSYRASRDIVKEALATNKDIQYVFDLHRDSMRRDITTVTIDGVDYAKIMIVIGKENPNYKKNAAFGATLHKLLEKDYPGLSRNVLPKEGKQTNGVFNQDLFDHAIIIEIGGVDNTLEEIYRTVDILADIFSDYYWEAEKVNKETEQ